MPPLQHSQSLEKLITAGDASRKPPTAKLLLNLEYDVLGYAGIGSQVSVVADKGH